MRTSYPAAYMSTEKENKLIETFRTERNKLLNFISSRIPDRTESEDILQDVFYKLTEAFQVTEPIEQVTAWLFKVARNKITDRYRKKKTIPLEEAFNTNRGNAGEEAEDIADLIFDPNADPSLDYYRSIFWDEFGDALESLPPEQRDVFTWHELDQMSFKEIAAKTGVPENTLISRKHYAVLALREQLQDLYFDIIDN